MIYNYKPIIKDSDKYYTSEVDRPVCVDHDDSFSSNNNYSKRHNAKFQHADSYQEKLNNNFEGVEYKKCKSNTSCNVEDIKGIIFGGQTSRFWVLRKHITTIASEDLHRLQFFSWECITIQL